MFRFDPPTMPHSSCPACQSKHVQWLSGPSKFAQVDYYRCRDCGHVWNVRKDNPGDPPRNVTPLPEKPE
jgi:transposase-like protein